MIYSFSKIYFYIISTTVFFICIQNFQKYKKLIFADKTTQTDQIIQPNIIDSSNHYFDDLEIIKILPSTHHNYRQYNLNKYSLFNPNYWK